MSALTSFFAYAASLLSLQQALDVPAVGDHSLNVVTPRLLELHLVSTQEIIEGVETFPTHWDFLTKDARKANAPTVASFQVTADGAAVPVEAIGFRRLPIYAENEETDLRVGNSIYLLLGRELTEGATIRVTDRAVDAHDYLLGLTFETELTSQRPNRSIHVNQLGFIPETEEGPSPKEAFVSIYLGDLGVARVDEASGEWVVDVLASAATGTYSGQSIPLGVNVSDGFEIVRADTGEVVFPAASAGEQAHPLTLRRDARWTAYSGVLGADFTDLTTPGWYQVAVPGMGYSLPFRIHEEVATTFARTVTMGLFHQRSGQDHGLPHTRFIDGPAHMAPAGMPLDDIQDADTYRMVARESNGYYTGDGAAFPAPQAHSPDSLLYPYVGDVIAWWPMDGRQTVLPANVVEPFDSFDAVTVTDPYQGDPNKNAFGVEPTRVAWDGQDYWSLGEFDFDYVDGFYGRSFANSFDAPEETEAEGVANQATGHLRTESFTLTESHVALLIAGTEKPYNLVTGGQQSEVTAANLIVGGVPVATATGENSNAMRWAIWDVQAYRGRQAYVEIIDSSTTGFVMVDEIMVSSQDGVHDVSSTTSHGRRVNGVEEQVDGGQIAGALVFDGIDDYVRIESLSGLSGLDAWTMSFWLRLDDDTRDQVIFATDGSVPMQLRYDATHQRLLGKLGDLEVGGQWRPLVAGDWHFITLKFKADSSAGWQLFQDFKAAGPNVSTAGLTAYPNTSRAWIGNDGALGSSTAFRGALDDLRLRASDVSGDELVAASEGFGPWVDVSGGHFDAGDYSKYMKNSGLMLHVLTFTVDQLLQLTPETVGAFDHLGIPESGDGICDLLQEAKWEADYIVKMQDTDGGFFSMVNPRYRRFENDVVPSQGDPQIVWPKTLLTSGIAVGALAQLAHSPSFQAAYPGAAARYRESAMKGWAFLEAAVAEHGVLGGHQRIFHYGTQFEARDELAFAAAAMFAMTGDPYYEGRLMEWMPYDTEFINHRTVSGFRPYRRHTFQRLYESVGAAMRVYAFANRGAHANQAVAYDDTLLLEKRYVDHVIEEILAAGDDQLLRAQESPFGVSVTRESKSFGLTNYFFAASEAFDIITAHLIAPKPAYWQAILSNVNYQLGGNPTNQTFISGIGWEQARVFVSQWAENDERALPPIGFTMGSINSETAFMDRYGPLLNNLSFPPLVHEDLYAVPYGTYDRYVDSFHIGSEFVILDQARATATASYLLAKVPGSKAAVWEGLPAVAIASLPGTALLGDSLTLQVESDRDLTQARVLWEAKAHEPRWGAEVALEARVTGENWVELEVLWPDGRRSFDRKTYTVREVIEDAYAENFQPAVTRFGPEPYRKVLGNPNVQLYYPLAGTTREARGERIANATTYDPMALLGQAHFDAAYFDFPGYRYVREEFQPLRLQGAGDGVEVEIPSPNTLVSADAEWVSVEAMLYIDDFTGHLATTELLSLETKRAPRLRLTRERWRDTVSLKVDHSDGVNVDPHIPRKRWFHVRLVQTPVAAQLYIDGALKESIPNEGWSDWVDPDGRFKIVVESFHGWVADLIVKSGTGALEVTDPIREIVPGAPYVRVEVPGRLDTANVFQPEMQILDEAGTTFRYRWTGPEGVLIDNPTARAPNITFNQAGDFLILVEVTDDDGLQQTGQVFVQARVLSENVGPTVNLGPSQTLTIGETWQPTAFVSDDGHPDGEVHYQWTQTLGPIEATISGGDTLSPTIEFAQGGLYHFQLTADDGAKTGRDQVAVLVDDPFLVNVPGTPFQADAQTAVLYHFDGNGLDASGNGIHLQASEGVSFSTETGWMIAPQGSSAAFASLGDTFTATIPDALILPGANAGLTMEWRYFPIANLAYSIETVPLVRLFQRFETSIDFHQNQWSRPERGAIGMGLSELADAEKLGPYLPRNAWIEMKVIYRPNGSAQLWANGQLVSELAESGLRSDRDSDWTLTLGNFHGYLDELRISRTVREETPRNRPPRLAVDPLVSVGSAGTMVALTQPAILDDGLPAGQVMSYEWALLSGEIEGIRILNPTSPQPELDLREAGNYTLRLSVSDGEFTVTGDTFVEVGQSTNAPPTVTLPHDLVSWETGIPWVPEPSITDEDPDMLTYRWTVDEGNAEQVVISDAALPRPEITFLKGGAYRLRLSVQDGVNQASDAIEISVLQNHAPVITLTETAFAGGVEDVFAFAGTVTDDELPSTGALSVLWAVTSGNADAVSLDNAEMVGTNARFSTPGDFVLTLTADDGLLESSAEVQVTILENQPPMVTIIDPPAELLWADRMTSVEVQVSDDGLPHSGELSYKWRVSQGEAANVAFEDDEAKQPTITFGEAGSYILQIRVSDSVLESTASWEITVLPPMDSLGQWRALHFSEQELAAENEESLWGDAADPDRDGLINLAEVYMGTNPRQLDANPIRVVSADQDTLRLQWRRAKDTRGIVVIPFLTESLASFEPVEQPHEFNVSVIEEANDWEIVEGVLSGVLPRTLFLRLQWKR